MVLLRTTFIILLASAAPSFADEASPHRTVNIFNHGARCNGTFDDTNAIRKAIDKAPVGGMVLIPPGRCVVSDTILINPTNAVSIVGAGRASQIYQRSDKTLFEFQGVNALMIKDVFLGSNATSAGTSLIKLTNSHHMRIDNVTMLGSYYGLYLNGSLLNTMVDLRSGINFQSTFFAPFSANQYWVYGERFNGTSANANTFIAPVLEGGVNGIWIKDSQAEGSATIVGGSIEGVSGTGVYLEKTFLPSSITGTHFAANGTADVVLAGTFNVRMSAIVALTKINLVTVAPYTTKNVQISDSIVEKIHIDAPTPFASGRIQLQNITRGLMACNPTDYDIQDLTVIEVNIACYPN